MDDFDTQVQCEEIEDDVFIIIEKNLNLIF